MNIILDEFVSLKFLKLDKHSIMILFLILDLGRVQREP